MRFANLGPLEVRGMNGVIRIDSPLQRLFLALLLSRLGSPVPRDTVIDVLWDGQAPGDVRKALGWHVLSLRKALGGKDRIVRSGGGYALNSDAESIDSHKFERLRREASAQVKSRPETASRQLREALGLWRGAAYADLTDPPQLRDEAFRLEDLRLSAMESFTGVELGLGRHSEVVPELTALVAQHPYRERFRANLMLALYRSGRQAEALRVFRDGQELSADQLGLDLGPSLSELHQRILHNDPALDVAERSPRATAVVPQQLPADIATFTGREADVETLLRTRTGGSPVAIIDGMAGIGKTTLAVHIAHWLAPQYPDGQLFLDLHGFSGDVAPVTAAQALERALRALGVGEADLPALAEERAALYRSILARKRVLVVLDNAADAEQIRALLPGAGGGFVLATSRRRFAELDDVHLVSLAALDGAQAIDMFTQAARIEPDDAQYVLIGHIVELCGRLPLAIRVAAQQLRRRSRWSLDDLYQRLSHDLRRMETLSVRNQSVAAAFEVSYRELEPELQRTFRMLALYPRTRFDARAAAALADIPLSSAQDQLDDMVDANLLDSPGPGRYAFHDLMRQFASAKSRHAETHTGREDAGLRLLDSLRTTAAVESEKAVSHPRLHEPPTDPGLVAFAVQGDTGGPSLEDMLTSAISRGVDTHVWQIADATSELATDGDAARLRGVLDQAARAADAASEPRDAAVASNNLAIAHLLLRQYPEAIENFQRSLEIRDKLGDVNGQAGVWNSLGVTHHHSGNLDTAAECLDRAVGFANAANADAAEARLITNYITLAVTMQRLDEALPLLNRARRIFTRNGQQRQLAQLDFCYGLVHGELGEPATALAHLYRALRYAERFPSSFGLSNTLTAIAVNLRALGRHDEAVDHHRRAIGSGGGDNSGAQARNHIEFGRTLSAVGDAVAALAELQEGLSLAARDGHRYEQARAEHSLAECHAALGDRVAAEAHLREAVDVYTAIGAPIARELRRSL
ncbi:MAG TPA: BTAD domain-containing putative transcriptional regulator [Stackebrandtia sp.]|uniref:AfsR/SARP family transcriptional regulator n=1 Tax=Stackebrandtia sp. TaxID=2023065 RepID=UPI002D75BC76|nr:BTAD domain-containing putative transcriptional regulator [Stackebrandtia sp.]HZE38161.1 BTAD domain-containing putative transcriptional regulator [Stackebrandtia sp.]